MYLFALEKRWKFRITVKIPVELEVSVYFLYGFCVNLQFSLVSSNMLSFERKHTPNQLSALAINKYLFVFG